MPLTEHDVASADKLRELELKAEHGHAEVFTALASSSRDGEPFMTFRGACAPRTPWRLYVSCPRLRLCPLSAGCPHRLLNDAHARVL